MQRKILYWSDRRHREVRDFRGAIEKSGYELVDIRTAEEVRDFLSKETPRILVVHSIGTETMASELIYDLDVAGLLSAIPVIYIADNADEMASLFGSEYSDFVPINRPFRIGSLVERFRKIAPSTSEDSKAQESTALQIGPYPDSKEGREVEDFLAESSCGGTFLNGLSDLSAVGDGALMPEHPEKKTIKAALDKMTNMDRWLGLHARRTALISSAVAKSVGLGSGEDQGLRGAGLVFNVGFMDKAPGLRQFDLMRQNADEENLLEIASALKRSSDFAHYKLGDDLMARTLRAAVEFVLGNNVVEEDDVKKMAECALAVELVDRACWSSGNWSNRDAYRVFSSLRTPKFFSDPDVISSTARVLCEAVTNVNAIDSLYTRAVNPRKRAEMKKSSEAAVQEAEELYSASSLMGLKLHELKPGMVLGRPLVARDGLPVLVAGTTLTMDLLMRLWQLASIRSLVLPAMVSKG